jgi:AcrR family transcriptional regulator
MTRAQRSDAIRNRAAVLAAAAKLFASGGQPSRVTMDQVAAEAGVGKGTLFRAFGSRAELVQALCAQQTEAIRQAVESGPPPLGPGAAPRARIAALLDALLVMHLDNPHLMLAAEDPSRGTTLYQLPDYQWAYQLLSQLLSDAGAGADNTLLPHILLGAIRAGLINELTASEHVSRKRLRTDLAKLVTMLVPQSGEQNRPTRPGEHRRPSASLQLQTSPGILPSPQS